MDANTSLLNGVFRVAPTGIGVVIDRVISMANQRLEEITGYTEKELLGQSARMLYPTQEDFEFVGEEKYRQISIQGTGQVETRWQRKDGVIINVLLASTPLDPEDHKKGVVFTALDITKRVRLKEALKAEKEKYQLLIDNQTDLIVKIRPSGEFIFVSPSYCRTFGKTESEILGKTFLPLVHPDDRDSTEEAMKKLYSPPHYAYMEQRAMTVSGYRWFAWIDTAIPDESGSIAEIIGVGRDISQQKEAEIKLQEKMKDLKNFNRLMVGRENRMLELKQEVNQLLMALGRPGKYNTPDSN
jgi:PAS domain S-box-containing protein